MKKTVEKVKVGNKVLVEATIFAISESGNPFIQFPNSKVKCLVKPEDIIEVTEEAKE